MNTSETGLTHSLADLHVRVLQFVYNYFHQELQWPTSRRVEAEFSEEGDIDDLAEMIGRQYIRCGDPSYEGSKCALTLRGIAICQGSERDVDHFLAVLPIFGDAYSRSERVRRERVSVEMSLAPSEAIRLFEIISTVGQITAGGTGTNGAWDEFEPSRESYKVRKVRSVEEFYAKLEELRQRRSEKFSSPSGYELRSAEGDDTDEALQQYTEDLVPSVATGLIQDEDLRQTVEADLEELRVCARSGAWKAVGLLAGSCCEAILIDLLDRNPACIPAKHAAQWKSKLGLREFARMAADGGLISSEGRTLIEVIKRWRDLVHPWRATSHRQPSKAMARVLVAFLELLAEDLGRIQKAEA